MKKHTAKIITLVLAIVCAVCLAVGLAGCNKSGNQTTTKYDAIYEAYAEVLDEDALSKTEWYSVYKDAIDAANLGDNFKVEGAALDGDDYVMFAFSNGKFYRLTVNGNDFLECVQFTLTTKDTDDALLKGVNLDIYYMNNGERVVWRTVKTDATTGTFSMYMPVSDTKTYGVQVSSTGDHNHTYGIPVGDEPTFSTASAEKSIEVVLSAVTVYRVTTENSIGKSVPGVKIGIFYNDADNKSEIVSAVTGSTGTLTAYVVFKETSNYIIKVDEDALPETYYCEENEFELNFTTNVTTISLLRHKSYIDTNAPHSADIAQQENNSDIRFMPVAYTPNENAELVFSPANGGYYMLGEQNVYVAFNMVIPGVHSEKTLLELAKEGFFVTEALHYEEGQTEEEAFAENVYDRVNYGSIITAYADKANDDGLYILNKELLDLLKAIAPMFEGYTGTSYDWQLALTYYYGPYLVPGMEVTTQLSATAVTINLKKGIAHGLYKIYVIARNTSTGAVINTKIGFDTTDAGSGWSMPTETVEAGERAYTYIVVNENTQSFMLAIQSGTRDATVGLELVQENNELVTEINETGDYWIPVLPSTFKSISKNQNDAFGVAIARRDDGVLTKNFAYGVQLLEPVEGYTGDYFYAVAHSDGANVNISSDKLTAANNYTVTNKNSYNSRGTYVEGNYEVSRIPTAQNLPRMYLTYASATDAAPTLVKVHVTLKICIADIKYDKGAEDATGSVASQSKRITGLNTKLNTNTFKREGYLFAGWKDDYGNFYEDGAEYLVPEKDTVTMVAQWKAINEVEVENKLGLGGPLNFTITAAMTSAKVAFAETVTAGQYKLTLTLDTNFGNVFAIKLGNKSINLLYDASSSNTSYVYIGYLQIDDGDTILIDSHMYRADVRAEFVLETYSAPAVGAGEDYVLVPVNVSSATEYFTFKLNTVGDSSQVQANSIYNVYIYNTTGASLTATLYANSTSIGTVTIAAGGTGVIAITTGAEVSEMVLYITGGSIYTAIGVKLLAAYSISFEYGCEDATGKLPETKIMLEGDSYTIPETTIERNGYTFMGWATDGDSVYDESKSYYNAGDSIDIQTSSVKFTAVWKKLTFTEAELGLGEDNKAQITIDSSAGNGTRVNLKSDVVAGSGYKMVAEFNALVPGDNQFLINIGYTYQAIMLYDESASDTAANKYVYRASFGVIADEMFLQFNVETTSAITGTLILEKLNSTLTADGNPVEIVVLPYVEDYATMDFVSTNNYVVTIPIDSSLLGSADCYTLTIQSTLHSTPTKMTIYFANPSEDYSLGYNYKSGKGTGWEAGLELDEYLIGDDVTGFCVAFNDAACQYYAGTFTVTLTLA